jgi:hypothetical protein
MEVEQTFSVIDGPIDWAALTPPNPATLHACHLISAPDYSVRASTRRRRPRAVV